MSIKPSSLKCNSCQEQNLETVTTALGVLERCPTCLSLWVEQKTLAAYSDDKVACRTALDETKALLLPTERWCPKCFQKMADGRVRSRGVILHLCQTCSAIWTDWETLKKFDEAIERALHAQVDAAQQSPNTFRETPNTGTLFPSTFRPPEDDSGMAKILRGLARTLDNLADGSSSTPVPKQPTTPKPPKPEPKPKVKAEAPKPAKPVEPKPEPVEKPAPERKILKAEPIPEPVVEKKPEPVVETPKLEPVIEKPKPEPVVEPPKPEPIPVSIVEQKPMPVVEPPKPEPAVQPVKPVPEPVIEKKPEPKPPIVKPGPKPIAPKVVSAPKVVKPKGPGLLSRLSGLLKPAPRPPKPVPPLVVKPVPPPLVVVPKVSTPVVPLTTEVPEVEPKPVPKPLSKPLPRPQTPRKPTAPSGFLMRALPITLALIAFFANVARGYDFEWSFGILWAMLFWSIGMMIRLIRFYPSVSGPSTSIKEIAARTALSPSKGYPVELAGVIEPADPAKPKGRVVFVQDGERIEMNRMFALDMVPRVFGISNPAQMILGEVILRGWYRRLPVSYIDVSEIQSGKKFRKSMVRALRWGCAVLVAVIATLILLTAE